MANITIELPDFDDLKADLADFVKNITQKIGREIVERVMKPGRRGKTYRRAKITKRATEKLKALGVKTYTTESGNERAIIGYEFHRASAAGESPVNDEGNLAGSIRAVPNGLQGEILINAEYAAALEYGTTKMAARPFVRPAIDYVLERELPKF